MCPSLDSSSIAVLTRAPPPQPWSFIKNLILLVLCSAAAQQTTLRGNTDPAPPAMTEVSSTPSAPHTPHTPGVQDVHTFENDEVMKGRPQPHCAATDPAAFGRNEGRWEKDMFRVPIYDAASCSYMQHKFTCGTGRSARINRWAWKQTQARGGSCGNTDFAHDGSAAVDAEFLRCTANKVSDRLYSISLPPIYSAPHICPLSNSRSLGPLVPSFPSPQTVVMMGDSNTRNSFVGMLCRFHEHFPPYVYSKNNGAMADTWWPPAQKKLKPGETKDPM